MPDNPLLQVEFGHRQGELALSVAFALTEPWTVLFGPSGSGKTTILRAIQGFVRPEAGRIVLHGAALLDTSRNLFLPPHRRPVRSAGQAARLFAGMTVQENILYGARGGAGWSLDELLQLLHLEQIARKSPLTLSGGERQRVALARAVVAAITLPGTLLLLDEPFSGLDLGLRDVLAVSLRDWLRARGTPVFSVTHDVGEVFLLKAEVVRLDSGAITRQGPASQVLSAERERLLRQLTG